MDSGPKKNSVSALLLLGFALSSIGGPFGLVSLYLIPALGASTTQISLATAIAILMFLPVIFIWYRYSEKIASSGGLYEFVKQAAGEKAAKVQAFIWIFSYFLYLPYTIAYLLFFIMPSMFSIPVSYLYMLEVLLPIAISSIILFGKKLPFYLLAFGGAIQVAAVTIFIILIFGKLGANANLTFQSNNSVGLGAGSAGISLLFICTNLPLFLGGEVKGGGKSIRKILLISFLTVVFLLLAFSFTLPKGIITGAPQYSSGFYIANLLYPNSLIPFGVGIVAIISLISLIIAEFVALSRLLYSITGMGLDRLNLYIASGFVLLDIVSLVNPKSFYNLTILPSLIALYISQLIVFLVYPLFAKRQLKFSQWDIALAAAAALLMIYGLYAGFLT